MEQFNDHAIHCESNGSSNNPHPANPDVLNDTPVTNLPDTTGNQLNDDLEPDSKWEITALEKVPFDSSDLLSLEPMSNVPPHTGVSNLNSEENQGALESQPTKSEEVSHAPILNELQHDARTDKQTFDVAGENLINEPAKDTKEQPLPSPLEQPDQPQEQPDQPQEHPDRPQEQLDQLKEQPDQPEERPDQTEERSDQLEEPQGRVAGAQHEDSPEHFDDRSNEQSLDKSEDKSHEKSEELSEQPNEVAPDVKLADSLIDSRVSELERLPRAEDVSEIDENVHHEIDEVPPKDSPPREIGQSSVPEESGDDKLVAIMDEDLIASQVSSFEPEQPHNQEENAHQPPELIEEEEDDVIRQESDKPTLPPGDDRSADVEHSGCPLEAGEVESLENNESEDKPPEDASIETNSDEPRPHRGRGRGRSCKVAKVSNDDNEDASPAPPVLRGTRSRRAKDVKTGADLKEHSDIQASSPVCQRDKLADVPVEFNEDAQERHKTDSFDNDVKEPEQIHKEITSRNSRRHTTAIPAKRPVGSIEQQKPRPSLAHNFDVKKYVCEECKYSTDRLNNIVYHKKSSCIYIQQQYANQVEKYKQDLQASKSKKKRLGK